MRIDFEHHIESSLSADELWGLLEDAFVDSRTSPIWPRKYETLNSDGLAEDATIRATYHVGPRDMDQTYEIPEYDGDQRRFVYRNGPRHPLDGGAEVRVESTEEGSILHWVGGYDVGASPSALGAAAFVKLWFEERFFDALRDNIAAVERGAALA
ncbi:MAG: SRPBCC family protein [Myxococcota bacterium]